MTTRRAFVTAVGAGVAGAALPRIVVGESRADWILIPMDDRQTNHLKAYGVTFRTLKRGGTAEWLLNYRGGSFLIPASNG